MTGRKRQESGKESDQSQPRSAF